MNKKQSESEKLCWAINTGLAMIGVIVVLVGFVLLFLAYPFTLPIVIACLFVGFLAWVDSKSRAMKK